MAFENLTNRLNKTFRNIIGKGRLSEKNMDAMLQDIRVALLESDVNYRVTQMFLESIKENFDGANVIASLQPAQMVYKIVRDQLIKLLGDENATLKFNLHGLTSIMIVGLQGSGKTTAAAKIAKQLITKQSKKVLLVAGDIVRPAAIEQLQVLAGEIPCAVFTLGTQTPVIETIRKAQSYAKENNFDTLIIDTAGRLHIDEELMQELVEIEKLLKPDEILLTADAMSGQDIVNVANDFTQRLKISGLIATKFDGDSKGGGVLSVKAISGVPVKFVSVGEKVDDLDIFYPERMADRILGMGDVMTLIEQAEEKLDADVNARSLERLMSGEFTITDMLHQLEQVTKMGPLSGLMGMIPGMNQLAGAINDEDANKEMRKQIAIMRSMTVEERENPQLLRTSRKSRIAKGSGTKMEEVNKLISTYEKSKKQMEMLTKMASSGNLPDFSKIFKQ